MTRLEIPGRPVPKGRPRVGLGKGVYTPAATRGWEETVAWYARAAGTEYLDPVQVRIELWSEHALRGDLDNYAKAILDGLQQGGLIQNDRQVAVLDVRFVIGSADKVVVDVTRLEAA